MEQRLLLGCPVMQWSTARLESLAANRPEKGCAVA
jgi:hypothetical protein